MTDVLNDYVALAEEMAANTKVARDAADAATLRRRELLDDAQASFAAAVFQPFADRWPKLVKLKAETTEDGGTDRILAGHSGHALALEIELDEQEAVLLVSLMSEPTGTELYKVTQATAPTFADMANALGQEIAAWVATMYLDEALTRAVGKRKASGKVVKRPVRKK